MKIHSVFHTNLFQKVLQDPSTNQVNELPPSVFNNNKKK